MRGGRGGGKGGQLLIHKRYMDGSKYVGFLNLFGTRVWSESLCVLLGCRIEFDTNPIVSM